MRKFRAAFLATATLLLMHAGWSADFEKGQEAYMSGDYETALTEWQPLAEEGNADGQYGMGLLYGNGFGVMMDDAQALHWYGLAAGQGHAEAQVNLAVMHANGWGVSQSDDEAFKWYSLAAEQGVIQAQMSLGKMYFNGFGAAKDYVQAHKWFNIAAQLGDFGAPTKLEDVAARMSPEEIAEADQLASTWLENHPSLQANE